MKGIITNHEGRSFSTHVMELTDHYATTTFGTFRKVKEEFRWVIDPRVKLQIDHPTP